MSIRPFSSKQSIVLGIDVGSVAVSGVEMSLEGKILRTHYAYHNGDVSKTLCSLLEGIEFSLIRGVAGTSNSSHLLNGAFCCDSRIACITAAKNNHKKVGSLLNVGGEKFSLIAFDPGGNYRNLKTNTSCAAGTGSFLDQQARRLNLSGSEELSRLALQNKGASPVIASRCSVFAKTDIVHAQQTGYSIGEICNGVCKGLADNIADILLSDEKIQDPIVFSGGVSRNNAVIKHLEKRTGKTLLIDESSHVYDAVGACLVLLQEINHNQKKLLLSSGTISGLNDLFIKKKEKKEFFYEPLSLKLSQNNYPEFDSKERYLHQSDHTGPANPVETDIYLSFLRGKINQVYLGIDIGSTSTKGVLLTSPERDILAGFYTRTAGRPIKAIQAILEAIEAFMIKKKITLAFSGVGTTGSGRKFAGEIIGADVILDEITAHARAAYELNPETDTIIEIGGQDSKFTTMKNGLVNFSQMNTVCAAGTGSFLEEQAEKLDVSLSEFSARAYDQRAPLVSDRCTVFMERDMNRFLNKKYSIDELLAASLFAVRDNYLLKVAAEGNIGSQICFQGATAKNKALVAAFEQKLQKPIYVSKYCHLTGAIGAALILDDEKFQDSHFRGIDIHKKKIPVRTEICELCRNHCRIRVAAVKNEKVAYGFLCGRDYDTHKFVDKNKSGFDLLKEREKVFHDDKGIHTSSSTLPRSFTIGLPVALHIFEDLPFWKFFFNELSLTVVTSEDFDGGVKLGKKLAGAEFCAPMNAIHGHARYLSDKADCIFLPIYLDQWNDPGKADKECVRHFCYYTQFSSSVISRLEQDEKEMPFIMPLIGDGKGSLFFKRELYKSLNEVVPQKLSFMAISRAYDKSLVFFRERRKKLKEIFREKEKKSKEGDIRVVLVGRPYTILSPAMNKGIPGIFASFGIKTYFQDMVPVPGNEEMVGEIQPLLEACHWRFAARILETAHFTTNIAGLYPVYITSFRCAPDSFTIEYFKRILDAKGKPYLILQLDEHDSNIGYETRIEAGVRSFRNHAASISAVPYVSVKGHLPVNPRLENDLTGKTLLFPNWESITSPLLVSNLQAAGIDARLLSEDETTVRESMRMNTGQCIPLNAIVLESIRYITRQNLDPGRTVLWMYKSTCSCNIGMYPYYIKNLFESHGKGMEKVGVYTGDISHIEISLLVTVHTYLAYLFGGLIRKLGCQIRPYEVERGETDNAIEAAIEIFKQAFRNRQNQSYKEAIEGALALFSQIRFLKTSRPKVAVFGDLYMRDNAIMNQDLIHDIENAGGEVLTTPYNEYLKIISSAKFKKWFKQGKIFTLLTFRPLLSVMEFLEKKYFVPFKRFIKEPMVSGNEEYTEIFSRFNMRLEQGGESWDNILKIFHIIKSHPDISLFVQTNPAFCCPALITEAQSRDIQRITGIPVVNLTYDGTGTPINDQIIPYLRYPRRLY